MPALRYPAARATATAASPIRCAERRRQRRRWRLLDHFLVAPLNRTLALEEVDDVAVVIGEDLELDVARLLDEPLDIQRAVAEGGRRFAPGLRDRARKRRRVANHLHPDSSAAFRWLQQQGEPDASRGCRRSRHQTDRPVSRPGRRARRPSCARRRAAIFDPMQRR